jgi:hypothetical protein
MATSSITLAQDKETPIQQALEQVRLMYGYALAEGKLDDGARTALIDVKAALTTPDNSALNASAIDFDKLLLAHAALVRIIAPATPSSLDATEPLAGWFGSLRRPPLIGSMILIAIASLFCFVAAGAFNFPKELQWASAASLGAVFYVLFTAHSYVKDRTFDLRYNAVYVIRYVLGVLAGIILAIVAFNQQLGGAGDQKLALVPAVIALLGGFSTEAVYQILQRMVDIMVAAVKGDSSDAAKTKAEQVAQKEFLDLAEDSSVSDGLKAKLIAAAKKVGA